MSEFIIKIYSFYILFHQGWLVLKYLDFKFEDFILLQREPRGRKWGKDEGVRGTNAQCRTA